MLSVVWDYRTFDIPKLKNNDSPFFNTAIVIFVLISITKILQSIYSVSYISIIRLPHSRKFTIRLSISFSVLPYFAIEVLWKLFRFPQYHTWHTVKSNGRKNSQTTAFISIQISPLIIDNTSIFVRYSVCIIYIHDITAP